MTDTQQNFAAIQTAQIGISCEIVGILIDHSVITAEEAARRFRRASTEAASSKAGLVGAQMLASVADFVELHHPSARVPKSS
jgi:hypothetical protein